MLLWMKPPALLHCALFSRIHSIVLLPCMFVYAKLNQENALLVLQQGVTHTPRGEACAIGVGSDN
ncbi:MAG: hypothetical protein GPOALKHO_000948 [Sodalis sp.]|nr:MAG: hypothetical protein GPOALKHO_000948 [Sodalis sp.]